MKNVIERAVLLCGRALIQPEDLSIDRRTRHQSPPSTSTGVEITSVGDIKISFPPWGISLDDVERRLIEEALKKTHGNVTRAAHMLHVSRDTLRYRMDKYKIAQASQPQNRKV